LFPSRCPERRGVEAGFSLIEVVVALAVAAVSIAAVGSLMAANVRGTRSVEEHVALVQAARTVAVGLDRADLGSGRLEGRLGSHSWRVDVLPFETGFAVAGSAAWVPQAVTITVQSPAGASLQIHTIRLRRKTGA
jgi:general secretion pathway protein I